MHIIPKIVPVFLLMALSTGCLAAEEVDEFQACLEELDHLTIYPSNPNPAYSIDLAREEHFGDIEDVVIGHIRGIDVDKSGRVFIADGSHHSIHVFHPGGSYLTSLGREGSGPGEFRGISWISIHDDRLYAYDVMQRRLSVYSLDSLAHARTINMNPVNQNRFDELTGYSLGRLYKRNNGTYLGSFSTVIFTDPSHPRYNLNSRYNLYYLLDADGRIISDQIFRMPQLKSLTATVKGEWRYTAFEFLGETMLTVSEDGIVFLSGTENFLVKVYDPDGNYLRAFYHPVAKRTFTREEAIRNVEERWEHPYVIEHRQSVIRHAPEEQIPEYWPVLQSMLLDDEKRLWVATVVEDQQVYEWRVVDEYGELLARFTWPGDRRIAKVKNGYLYTRETDETGMTSIVRYRIEMEKITSND